MRAYVSGPMSGLLNHNYDAFAEAAHWLRQHFCENVVSPHEILPATEHVVETRTSKITWRGEHSWDQHMRADIVALMECDTIVMLPGWPTSRGARLELTIAMELGFAVFFYIGGELIPMGRP